MTTTHEEDTNLGELLWRLLLVTRLQIEQALTEQQRRGEGTRFGQCLVEAGALSNDDLDRVLRLQLDLRSKDTRVSAEAAQRLIEWSRAGEQRETSRRASSL
jgi:hypothetical protein